MTLLIVSPRMITEAEFIVHVIREFEIFSRARSKASGIEKVDGTDVFSIHPLRSEETTSLGLWIAYASERFPNVTIAPPVRLEFATQHDIDSNCKVRQMLLQMKHAR